MTTEYSWHRHNVPSAKALRGKQTPAEVTLWEALRNRRLEGLKFRRQHPIGSFVVDFCFPERSLIVELDGDVHATQVEKDREREQALTIAGYRVLRFSNESVYNDLPGVLTVIRDAAQSEPSHPPTSPRMAGM